MGRTLQSISHAYYSYVMYALVQKNVNNSNHKVSCVINDIDIKKNNGKQQWLYIILDHFTLYQNIPIYLLHTLLTGKQYQNIQRN